jgi:hypothetical protein
VRGSFSRLKSISQVTSWLAWPTWRSLGFVDVETCSGRGKRTRLGLLWRKIHVARLLTGRLSPHPRLTLVLLIVVL